ncbi:cation:proton antiporter [Mycobacterium sp. CVI_P3]|uniref:Cation:proton antiporter n=1 Tax=Mycobacterium pinniadriaticum TaxID=2994102 RepID=A0ABT3SL19_9MYCO|nr:cation:proton antiporter [Mycobacterium pinniadriaticum]MCX2933792.1 cation:proton antiporter [Mycobacterium pinniadriaticum]MCX2940214.1 cation:proton antiporter [Mycobacterium pinniadriaticum]
MHTATSFVLTLLVLGYAVVSGLVNRWYVAPALIFVVIGMVFGPFGFNLLAAGSGTDGYTVLAQLALTVILFNQAAKLDPTTVFRRGHLTVRLLVIGIPLTFALGTLTAVVLLPVLPWWEAVCLAAIVAPTEVALIDALLEDDRIPDRVRNALSVESGFYDGFALAVLLGALALASARTDQHPSDWGWFVVRTEFVSLIIGAGVGLLGALLIAWSRKRAWMSDTWAQLATLAIALICFEFGERVHASGFVAAFTGGLAFAVVAHRGKTQLSTQVSDATAQLLELLVFAMFGAFAVIDAWQHITWRVLLFCVVALFGVRMVAVLVALIRTDLPAYSRLFIGWFGPRGIGTVVLGLLVIARGDIQHAELLTQAGVIAVTLSLVLHSLTAPLGIARYERLAPSPG